MVYECLELYGNKLSDAINSVSEVEVGKLIDQIYKRMDGISEIHLVGNGGSAANSSHIAGDYTKTFSMLGTCLRMNSLSDNGCYITAASNDLDFSEVYELLINTRVKKNDLIVFLSGSGNSLNLVKAARVAKTTGIKTSAVVGFTGGALKNLVDIPIQVSIDDMEIAEDCQMAIFHYIKQILCRKFNNDNDDIMPKYYKRIGNDLIA